MELESKNKSKRLHPKMVKPKNSSFFGVFNSFGQILQN
jgi:hypothetical protein